MDMGFDMPWVGGSNTMDKGLEYHGWRGAQYNGLGFNIA
jgi:hypothetical protein